MAGRWFSAGGVFMLLAVLATPAWGQQPFPGEPPQSQNQSKPQAEPFPGEPAQTQPSAAPNVPRAAGRPPVDPRDPNLYLPTFRVSTSVVIVPTLVEKPDGSVLYGLKEKDFEVLDNGVPQKLQVDDDLDMQPVSLVVCVERGRDAPLEFDKIGHLGPLLQLFTGDGHGQVALVAFDSNPTWVEPFTDNSDAITRDLENMPAGDGGAAILDAVGYSVNLLEQQPPDHRRVLLLISESRDHGSRHFNIPELVERIGTSNTLVLSMEFSPSKAEIINWAKGEPKVAGGGLLAGLLMTMNAMRRNTPKTLAALSGGEYDPFTKEKGFEQRVAEAASHARNRYILSFHPTDLTPGLHTIEVKLTQDYGAQVVARNSYWAIRRDAAGQPQ
ncbi:MAG TPA: VWA domain-containing protein [Acidobacteriaceae bacterium]|jgi:VWFA-related protein|nr:VWA domain-containing protein [Acidobacteriaceae bacterium]